jgi:hypothetical protein
MKKILTTTALLTLLMTTSATAGLFDEYDNCEIAGDMADMAMTYRQGGTMELNEFLAMDLKDITKAIYIMAFDPAYDTEEYNQQVVDDFRTMIRVMCYKQNN